MGEQTDIDNSRASEMSSEVPALVGDSSCSSDSHSLVEDLTLGKSSKTKERDSKPAKRKSTKKSSSKSNLMDKEPSKKELTSKPRRRKSTDDAPSDSKPARRKSTDKDPKESKPRRRKSTDSELESKPRRRKSTDSQLESKPSRRKSTDKEPKESKPPKRKSTNKPPKRKSKDETVIEPPPKEEIQEPDYLDPNFVPSCLEERRSMLIARAKYEAEMEASLHQKRVEAAKLNAQAELELQKADFRMKLRKQTSERQMNDHIRAKIRRDSIEEDNEHFFAGVNNMNAQLMERAVEFKESLQEQEQQGLIMIRALDNRGQAKNKPAPTPILPSASK